MSSRLLLLPISVPLVSALAVMLLPRRHFVNSLITIFATAVNGIIAMRLFGRALTYSVAWGNFGLDFSLRLYHFSSFIMLACAGFAFLIALYSSASMATHKQRHWFYGFLLISLACVNGAVLADNLLILLLFWEALLLPIFGMIIIGGKDAFHTAVKSLIIVGISDVCLMAGTILVGCMAGTLTISNIHLPLNSLGSIAFLCLMIGAVAKAGAMPFHTWIPDAATDAPVAFMAFLPAALEKLLGIYFLARISLDLFNLVPSAWVSTVLMSVGIVTILCAVMMALIQKDYKKLLSYHAVSQVGYMMLGIGTAVPAGIVGGLFHMINHALYKGCLFLTSGAVEKQAGTTDLEKLGGLGRKMPVTFICFIIAAAAISGVPPLNGFFSKELVYDGALERGWFFYLAAALGSFLTAASFLKLGHAVYLGKPNVMHQNTREASWPMLIPMIVIALACVLFGVYNALPLSKLIQPVLGNERLEGHTFIGMPSNAMLVVVTLFLLAAAFLNHRWGVKKSGRAAGALDHIHYARGLSKVYDYAEKKYLDPYETGIRIVEFLGKLGWYIDRGIDFLYERVLSRGAAFAGELLKSAHNGSYTRYISWSLWGLLFMALYMLKGM